MYVGGNSIATALRMVGGFLSTRLVEPDVVGLFSGFSLILGYLPFLGMGVFEGLNRELPYHYGKQNKEKTKALPGTSQAWAILLGTTCAAILLFLSLSCVARGNWQGAAGWATVAILAFLLFVETNYLRVLYRVYDQFSHLARVSIIQAIVGLVLVVAVWQLQFYGLCIRAIGIGGIAFLMLWRWRPVKPPQRLDIRETTKLIKVGAPILFASQLLSFWFVLNRTMVLQYLGNRGLGLYALFPMIQPALALLPYAVSQAVYPRMLERYSKKESLRDALCYLAKPLTILVIGMSLVVLFIWMLMPTVVRILLPKYVEGVPAARWATLGVLASCLTQLRIVFFTIGKTYVYIGALICGMVTYGLALFCLTRNVVELVDFPQAMLIGQGMYLLVTFSFLLWYVRQEATSVAA